MAKVKTLPAVLKYVFITGEGRNNAMQGEEPRMQFVASIITKKDSEVHKHIKEQIDAEWADYKKAQGIKGLPKTNGIKEVFVNDPSGKIDPETEEIARIPSGDVLITFKTNTTWPDGNTKDVKVYANAKDAQGKTYAKDVTAIVQNADWSIGDGSEGIIHGVAQGNNIGGTHKVTLYLNAVQLTKLEKYTGDTPELEEVDGVIDDFDDDAMPTAAPSEDEAPAL